MNSAETRRKKLTPARIVITLVSLGVLFGLWRTGQKWVVVPVGLVLLTGYVLLPRLRASRVRRFHKQALALLAKGQADEVPGLVKRNLFLQLVGPRSALDAKLGLAYLQTGRYDYAVRYLREAISHVAREERLPLEIGLAKAHFVTGDFENAEEMALGVEQKGTRLAEMMCIVARSRLLANKMESARTLLKEAEGFSPSPDVKWMIELVRTELALKAGSALPKLAADSEPTEAFLKGWRHAVRGRICERDGRRDRAEEHYRQALRLGSNTFIELEIGEYRETEEKRPKNQGAGSSTSPRKKRRKRR